MSNFIQTSFIKKKKQGKQGTEKIFDDSHDQ